MSDLLAPEHLGHRPGSSEYRRIALALFAAGVVTFALLYSTQALLPELVTAFSLTPEQSALSLSVATLGIGVTLLVAGTVSEVVGRTPLIHLSMGLAVVVALACAAAPTWHVLLGLRLLEGVALAGLPAVATAYLREELHPDTHARAAGLYVGGTALGGMIGRLLPGGVGELLGWRWAMLAVGLLALVCAVAVRVLLPASQHFTPAPSRLSDIVSMTRRAVSDPALLALYGIGACVLGAFIAVSNTVGFRVTGAPFGLGLGTASLLFLVYPLGTLSSTLAGRLSDRLGRRAVLPIGCAVALVGVLVTLPDHLPLIVLGLALLTMGFFAVHGVASGWVPARAHAGGVGAGQAASLYLFSYYAGSSVFGSIAGRAWSGAGWSGVVTLSGVLLGVTALLAAVLARTPTLLPHRPEHLG